MPPLLQSPLALPRVRGAILNPSPAATARNTHTRSKFGLPLGSCGRDLAPLLRALAAGLFYSAAVPAGHMVTALGDPGDAGTHAYRLAREPPQSQHAPVRLRLHPSSVLWRCQPACVLFLSAPQGDSGWHDMQEVVAIDAALLPEVAPHFYRHAHLG